MIFLKTKFANFVRDIALNVSKHAKHLLLLFLAVIIFLPPTTCQILPSSANIESKKRVTYKEIRKRKHSKNKPNLKNQVGATCSVTPIIKTETLSSTRNATSAVWNPINNKVYIFGGLSGSSVAISEIVEYDPATGTVTTKSETLPSGRWGTSAVWNPVNNKVYIFGGVDNSSTKLNQIIEYDPATGTVTTKAETLSTARSLTSAIWNPVNNKVYIFGGSDNVGALNQIVEYNPASGTLTTKAETLPSARHSTSIIWNPINNKAYIIAGSDNGGTRLSQIIEYDPATGTVTTKSETLPSGRSRSSAIWNPINSKAYVFGGQITGGSLSQIVEYDPTTGTVTTRSETLPTSRWFTSAIWNPINSKTYIFGGQASSGFLSQIVEYTPCNSPSNPSISSVTINGVPQTVASSYRITTGQTFVANISSTDSYPGNKVTISCNPPAGRFTLSPAYAGTGRLEFLATAADVGNTYTYTFAATSDSGAIAVSTLTFTVVVSCSSDGPNGICVRGAYCTPCGFVTGICASDPSCVFTAPSQPLISSPASPAPVVTPASTLTPTPIPTVAPVANATPQQGVIVSPPSINTAPTSTSTPKPSGFISVSEGTVKGISSTPQPTPTNIPGLPPGVNYFDISKLKPKPSNNVKPDSVPYIDFSEQK